MVRKYNRKGIVREVHVPVLMTWHALGLIYTNTRRLSRVCSSAWSYNAVVRSLLTPNFFVITRAQLSTPSGRATYAALISQPLLVIRVGNIAVKARVVRFALLSMPESPGLVVSTVSANLE